MKKIKLFLASSSELKTDREQFEIFINRKNNEWVEKGIFLQLQVWEDFLDAMSSSRLQEEYNKAIRACDIFVMLFFTKVGKYTEEEFETAFGKFKETNRPFIFTYFKNAEVFTGTINRRDMMSLFAFQEKLEALGHFSARYNNIDDLKFQFNNQLNKLFDTLTVDAQEERLKLSEQVAGPARFIEQGNTAKGLRTLRAILKSRLEQIAEAQDYSTKRQPPMHILRALAKKGVVPARAQASLEYALSVIDKSMHGIDVDRQEAMRALVRSDEGLGAIARGDPTAGARAGRIRYVLKQTPKGQFVFNLVAANRRVILTSEPYAAKESLVNAIQSVNANVKRGNFERKTSSIGKFYFIVKAANRQILAQSGSYASRNAMEHGISWVQKYAPGAQIVDRTASE